MVKTKQVQKKEVETIEELYSDHVEVIYSEELSRILEQAEQEYREGKTFTEEEVLKELYEEFGIQI